MGAVLGMARPRRFLLPQLELEHGGICLAELPGDGDAAPWRYWG